MNYELIVLLSYPKQNGQVREFLVRLNIYHTKKVRSYNMLGKNFRGPHLVIQDSLHVLYNTVCRDGSCVVMVRVS